MASKLNKMLKSGKNPAPSAKLKTGGLADKFDQAVGQALYFIDTQTDYSVKETKGKTKSEHTYTIYDGEGKEVKVLSRVEVVDFAKEQGFKFEKGGIPKDAVSAALHAYAVAALWSSTNPDKGDAPLDQDYSVTDIDPASMEKMRQDVERFMSENKEALEASELEPDQIGHDFWLSRNGHGSGFFARGLEWSIEKQLMEASHDFGECYLYVGDDEKVHVDGGKTNATPVAKEYNREDLGKIYEDVVGYDIAQDDPDASVEGIVQLMKEYDEENPDQPFLKRGVYSVDAGFKDGGAVSSIDFATNKEAIANYNDLPKPVQNLIDAAERMEVSGLSGLLGYIGRRAIWDGHGHWHNNAITLKSVGGKLGNQHIVWSQQDGLTIETSNQELNLLGLYLKLTTVEGGDLRISLTQEGKEWVAGNGPINYDTFPQLFEDIEANSELMFVDDSGEAGFGLTNAPSILDGYYLSDNGDGRELEHHDDATVWAFLDYQIQNPFTTLSEEGSVVFEKVHSHADDGKFAFGGTVSAEKLNEALQKVQLYNLEHKGQPLVTDVFAYENEGYKKLYDYGFIYAIFAGEGVQMGVTSKGYEFLAQGAVFEKGGVLKIVAPGEPFTLLDQGALRNVRFTAEIVGNIETTPRNGLLATIRDHRHRYLASIEKVDGATYPHFQTYARVLASAPQALWHLQAVLRAFLSLAHNIGDPGIKDSALVREAVEFLEYQGISHLNEDYALGFSEGGALDDNFKQTTIEAATRIVEYCVEHGLEASALDFEPWALKYNEHSKTSPAKYVLLLAYSMKKIQEEKSTLQASVLKNNVSRIANHEVPQYARNRFPFKAMNLEGKTLDNGDYVILSHGTYPVWLWVSAEDKWYGNEDKPTEMVARHLELSRPATWQVTMLSHAELTNKVFSSRSQFDLGGMGLSNETKEPLPPEVEKFLNTLLERYNSLDEAGKRSMIENSKSYVETARQFDEDNGLNEADSDPRVAASKEFLKQAGE